MSGSERLFARSIRVMPKGVNSPVRFFDPNPFFVESGKSAVITDVDGRNYIDFVMGYGALLFGHAYTPLVEEATEALSKGSLYGAPTESEVVLAERIAQIYPSMEMSRAVNSGTEATMHSIRAARSYTKRKKIIKFDGCFHGSHDSVLVKAGSGASTFGVPSSGGGTPGSAEHTLVAKFNDADSVREAFKKAEKDVAAVIIEPVIANYGLILPKPGFLKELREICDENSSVLIFDEIVTGFRLCQGGAQKYYSVNPDMTTLGKVLGGGLPIAMYGGIKEIMSGISPLGEVYQAGTFSGNPVSVKVALKVIELTSDSVYDHLRKSTENFVNKLTDAVADSGIKAAVNSVESMFQIFLGVEAVNTVDEARRASVEGFRKFHRSLLLKGVFSPPSQFETNFVSAAHTERDLELAAEAFTDSIRGVGKSI
ncbi:MAG: glutamate-1-semialdehyde 2,1-aminomutase [Thermoprotei archaeon]